MIKLTLLLIKKKKNQYSQKLVSRICYLVFIQSLWQPEKRKRNHSNLKLNCIVFKMVNCDVNYSIFELLLISLNMPKQNPKKEVIVVKNTKNMTYNFVCNKNLIFIWP